MQILRDVSSLRAAVSALKADGGRGALVPTMGALLEGHMRLVGRARAMTNVVSDMLVAVLLDRTGPPRAPDDRVETVA